MEMSLDEVDRTCVVEFVKKCREDYDRLLDEAPDIPAISIQAFNIEFPNRNNKPDVCNGLSIIVSDDTNSQVASTNAVQRWISAFSLTRRRSKDGVSHDNLNRIDVV